MSDKPKAWHAEEMLEHMAFNLFQSESDAKSGEELAREWEATTTEQRDALKERAREKRDAFIAMTPAQQHASNQLALYRLRK